MSDLKTFSSKIILGMGNPLLDMSSVVDESLLAKYSLKANDAILYDKEDIFDELKTFSNLEYIPGGATQNSIRVAQWILQKPKMTLYMGSIGNDEYGRNLTELLDTCGVGAHYQIQESVPTGRCAVLITGANRSLVTKLDAANNYSLTHLESNWELVEKSGLFYSAGFFLTVCPEAMMKVAKHASENSKIYCLNLSAPFLCQFFKDPMDSLLPYADIVFGNESEAEAYAESHSLTSKDPKSVAQSIAALPKINATVPRTVIITQGNLPVIVVRDSKVLEFPVEKIPASEIIDTNGAGDAFVGGYLAQLAQGAEIDKCVKCGIWAASLIIKRSGCTFPDQMNFKA